MNKEALLLILQLKMAGRITLTEYRTLVIGLGGSQDDVQALASMFRLADAYGFKIVLKDE